MWLRCWHTVKGGICERAKPDEGVIFLKPNAVRSACSNSSDILKGI